MIEMLEAWVSVAPPEAPFDEVVDVLPSPKCVSEGMQVRLEEVEAASDAAQPPQEGMPAHITHCQRPTDTGCSVVA